MPLNAQNRFLTAPERQDIREVRDELRALCAAQGHPLYLDSTDKKGNLIYRAKGLPTFKVLFRREISE
jgi:hypothetical protein